MGNKASSYKFEGREFIRDSQLSEKGYSTVHLAHDSKSGEQFALKIVICPDEDATQEAMKVVEAYQLLMHPAVMPLAGYSIYPSREVKGGNECAMLFPFFPDGTLQDAISPNNAKKAKVEFVLHEADLVFFFIDLCESVDAMHQVGYTHRNIKPSNVLLRRKTNARGELTYRPVLKNFSFVAPAAVEVRSREDAEAIRDRAESLEANGYRAPELFDVRVHSIIDAKSDVWALGCTLYAMAFGHSPFEHPDLGFLLKELKAGNVQFPPNRTNPVTRLSYSSALCDIMTWMLSPQPAARPSLAQVLARLRTLPVCLAGEQEEEEPYSVSYSDVAGGGPITFFQLRGHAIPSLKRIAENEQSVFSFLKQTSAQNLSNPGSAEPTQTGSFSSAAETNDNESIDPQSQPASQPASQPQTPVPARRPTSSSLEGREQAGKSQLEAKESSKERAKKEQESRQLQRLETLERGVELVKFGRKGRPHKTLFKLVEGRSTLQWVSKGEKERQIRLCEVRKMTEGHETDVFARFAKSQQYKAKRHLCFSLIFMEGSEIPTLDVMCETDEEYAVAFNGLRELIFPDQRY